tara:strand:- start:640 stop:846 length:207 start_codon:yes stop_codon:yes gene_type:complete
MSKINLTPLQIINISWIQRVNPEMSEITAKRLHSDMKKEFKTPRLLIKHYLDYFSIPLDFLNELQILD